MREGSDMLRIRTLVLLTLVSVCAFPARSAETDEVHPVVLDLLDPERREEAFADIITWKKNLFNARLYPPADRKIGDVLACPQPEGPPLYVVFSNAQGPRTRMTILDSDGTIIPFYQPDKVITDRLKDVNGDGCFDIVGTLPIRIPIGDWVVYMEALFVLPISRENRAALTILYNASLAHRPLGDRRWGWRLNEISVPDVLAIEIGPQISGRAQIEPRARYTWSAEEQRYVGPAGGYELGFLRIEGEESEEIRNLAEAVYEEGRQQVAEMAEIPGPVYVGGDVKPPERIHDPNPQYTAKARKVGVQGVVIAQVVIDKKGEVTKVKILKGLSHGLSESAAKTLKKWRFKPATLHGEPVEVYYNLTVNFRLKEGR